MRRQINAAGRDIIKMAEGLKLVAYKCPAGVLTIGWGHTGPDVKPGLKIDRAQAEDLLDRDLAVFERGVDAVLGNATDNQFSACVSLAYNIGLGAFGRSSVLHEHKAGNFEMAAQSFGLWKKGGGKVLPGLVKRRAAEAALYLKP